MSSPRWGDDADDSDDERQAPTTLASPVEIPPTHKSRIDKNGVQIVTSYRANANGQIIKTVTKQKVETVEISQAKAIQQRLNTWKPFGQAAKDNAKGVKTTVQSKDEILIEDPNADTDLQDEDPAAAIAGNLNAFWAKQQRRHLERKYDVEPGQEGNVAPSGWTKVGEEAAAPAASDKYVPPSQRVGARAVGGGTAFSERKEDLTTIRVTNLSENTSEADLQELFSRYGRISRVYLAKDKETMQSRGFAFVSFVNQSDAARAMEELQGVGYDHLILKLEWARPNKDKDPGSSGTQFRSGYGKALAQDTKSRVSYASNLTK